MLALKSMRMTLPAIEHATSVQELPSEIIDLIAEQLYESGFGQLDTLYSFSFVNHQFRESALPFLFSTISHSVRDRLDQKEHGLLRRLLYHPGLICHVRNLHVVRPPDIIGFAPSLDAATDQRLSLEHQSSDLRVIRECLPLMLRLRRIRYATTSADHSAKL